MYAGGADGGDGVATALEQLPFVSHVAPRDGLLELTLLEAENHVPELVDVVRDRGGQLRSLNLRRPTLEDVFLHYTGSEMRDAHEDAGAISRAQRRR